MKLHLLLLLCYVSTSISYFLNFKFGNPFKVRDTKINIPLPDKTRERIEDVSGFYGLIGPNVNMMNVTSLFQMFMGDGTIQGVFFDQGNVTYVQHHIQTEKLKYEQKNGKIPKNPFVFALFLVFSKLRLLPNHLGLANTALLHTNNNNTYALYERDLPYQLDIDYTTNEIHTIKRNYLPHIRSFSGHTKYRNKMIETIDYDVMSQSVDYYIFSEDLKEQYKKRIKTNYMPVIHDFVSNNNTILLTDVPIIMDFTQVIKTTLPVRFDKTKPSYIHVLDKNTGNLVTYVYDKGIYMFHHSHTVEDDTNIYLYTCVYDDFNYMSIDIKASYRCIVLNKISKKVSVIRNEETEKYNLDFPVIYKNKTVLRNLVKIEDGFRINGFVLCDGLNIEKKYIYQDISFCGGDPNIVEINGNPHICSFAYSTDFKKNYFCFIPLHDEEPIFIDLPIKTNVGFHSIFINNHK
uniref:Uncharacterized protein n=1 Tax=viral metagenome TaxID=1070528 RepID=A0A6C0AT55_9ZZZZ